MMGYLFIIGLILILAIISGITIRVGSNRFKKKCDEAAQRAEAWGKDGWKEIK